MEKPFPAYKGDEPYVFVCYSHEDSEVVYLELEWLHRQGVNIWYDEGISAGRIWRKEIAEAIQGASKFLYYISKAALASDHCNREVDYALDKAFEVVPVFLEEIQLTPELDLALNRVQALHRKVDSSYQQHLLDAVGGAIAVELQPVDRSEPTTRFGGRKLGFIASGVLAFALVLFAVDRYLLPPDTPPAADSAEEIVVSNAQQSIAVLSFVNMSDDPANEYFSDGLSEEIMILLAKISGLKVIGRTSSFAFKGKKEDLRVIGKTLGVKTVLEGSVSRSGNQVRIIARLVDVVDGAQIWSGTYEQTMTDIFSVQDEVATAIIDALQIHVASTPTRGQPTENFDAYALFLKARGAANLLDFRTAEALAKETTQLDPHFAEAYELLAFTYWQMAGIEIHPAEAQVLAGEASARALAIDPDLTYAEALNKAATFGPKLRLRKIQAFEQAAREQPNNLQVMDALIILLSEHGYLEEALRLAERYVELDPLSLLANFHLSTMLYAVGRTNEAITALEFTEQMNLDPNFWQWTLVGINLVEGHNDEAIAYFEPWLEKNNYPNPNWFRDLVTAAQDAESGQLYLDKHIPQIIAAMPEDELDWKYGLTVSYLYLGFLDRFFELIYDTGPTDATWGGGLYMEIGTIFRRQGFTAHPDYLKVAGLLGIVDTWEERGPPDFCDKLEGQWVCE